MIPPPPTPTLFPYTTLFRSLHVPAGAHELGGEQIKQLGMCRRFPLRTEIVDRPDQSFAEEALPQPVRGHAGDRKSTRLNSSHVAISYAVFCLKKKTNTTR